MNLTGIIQDLKEGKIPRSLSEKETLIKAIDNVAKLETSLISQIVATARTEDFQDNEPQWSAWVTEKFGYSKERRCHLNAIGRMLIGMREKYPEFYERLFYLDSDKNLAIVQLYRAEYGKKVVDFLKSYHVERMSRDEVRVAVAECMGFVKTGKDKPMQPELPGFTDNINRLYDNLGTVNPMKLIETFNLDVAKKTMSVGMNCMRSASEFYKRSGSYQHLTVEELNQMEAAANKIYQQFREWREATATRDLNKAG